MWLLLVLLGAGLVIVGFITERRQPPSRLLPPTRQPAAESDAQPGNPDIVEVLESSANTPPVPADSTPPPPSAEQHPTAENEQNPPPLQPEEVASPTPSPPITSPRLNFRFSFDHSLFILALVVYLLTRLVGLDEYPTYFFTDEAINTTLASDFLRDGWRDAEGQALPTFFRNYDRYNLSTSVYLQVLPSLLFDRSVAVTRGTAVLVTMLAAVSVGLILHQIFESRAWWSGVLILSLTPAWFLHSRTAFETALMVAFYAPFLYFYLLYRRGSPRALYASVLCASLAFYTYSPARVIIPLTALLFLVSDLRYHLSNRRTVLMAGGLVLICALPYLRFQLTHPQAAENQLYFQGSYWLREGSLTSKIATFFLEYFKGLNPLYWFAPGEQDIARHRFGPYGHLLLPLAPFLAAGFIYSLLHLRLPAHRNLLLAALAIPAGSALIEVGITRVLALVIPVSIYTALGVAWLLAWLARYKINYRVLESFVFLALVGINVWILGEALGKGPTWTLDYGLTGVQWGARQVFSEIKGFLAQEPGTIVTISSTWANGTDTLARFFLNQDPLPVQFASIDYYLGQKVANLDQILVVVPFYEYQRAVDSGKFAEIQVEEMLAYPDGEPGFYFLRLKYSPDIDALLDAENEFRRQPQEDIVEIDGEQVAIRFSRLDIGPIQNAFDGDSRSMCRTEVANPAVLELVFTELRTFSAVSIVIGSTEAQVSFTVSNGEESETVDFTLRATEAQPEDRYELPARLEGDRVRLEIQDLRQGEPGNVHFWEIRFSE